jgi:hypothetical protein
MQGHLLTQTLGVVGTREVDGMRMGFARRVLRLQEAARPSAEPCSSARISDR